MKFAAKLLLENGISFEGIGFGFQKIGVGEVVFNTAITGYQEILTDPSYDGQIITFTYPHIGNVGTNDEDLESFTGGCKGIVIRETTKTTSNWRNKEELSSFLKKKNITGISGIDTRKLTRILREEGSQPAVIAQEEFSDKKIQSLFNSFGDLKGKDLAKKVTCQNNYNWDKGSIDI